MTIKVKVTGYKDMIVIEAQEPQKELEGWTPMGPGRVGSVLSKTAGRLGVSDEAIALLKKVKRSHDAIGDVMWWPCVDGSFAFGWMGGFYAVFDPKTAEGDRQFTVPDEGHYVPIPNDVPPGAMKWIDGHRSTAE